MPVEPREQVTHITGSQRATGGTPGLDGRRQPSLGGTSRMSRETHVRICEGLGVKFRGPTRRDQPWSSLPRQSFGASSLVRGSANLAEISSCPDLLEARFLPVTGLIRVRDSGVSLIILLKSAPVRFFQLLLFMSLRRSFLTKTKLSVRLRFRLFARNPMCRAESLAKHVSIQQDESMTFPYFTSRQVFRSALLFFFLLAVLAASSGKSVKMITSWLNPNYEGQTFHRILVIGVAQNLEVRADFEDEMAAQITRQGIETIPGNHILLRPDANVKLDLDYLRGQIRDNHIDAVVVSRLLKVDKKVTIVPSSTYIAPYPYYYSFYGYLGAVYPMVYDPGYTREDTTVSVETNVYATSKPDGDLVWNGVSKSFNPKSAKKIADGLVKEVPKQMEKDGLLPKKVP
jgi:hypothetical protein